MKRLQEKLVGRSWSHLAVMCVVCVCSGGWVCAADFNKQALNCKKKIVPAKCFVCLVCVCCCKHMHRSVVPVCSAVSATVCVPVK